MNNGLEVLLSDDFTGDFDLTIWTTDLDIRHYPLPPPSYVEVTAGDGTARISASTSATAGPGIMAYGGFTSQDRLFTPNLTGTNLLEVTLLNYTHDDEYLNKYLAADGAPSDHEDEEVGPYLMGFCLSIGTFQGLVGSERDRDTDRVVQIHFDWWSKAGLGFTLNRNIIPDDKGKIRVWGSEADKAHMRATNTIDCPVMTIPGNSVSLACPHNPVGDHIAWGHRYGLLLTDDGNTLSWMLDGKVMDAVDISGFFDSSPGCVVDGAYATIAGGASYRHNVWTLADLRICVGRSDA